MDGLVITPRAAAAAHVRRHASLYIIAIVLLAIVSWQMLAMAGLLRPDNWPAPTAIGRQLGHDLWNVMSEYGDQNSTVTLLHHVGKTLSKWVVGFAASIILGVTIGFLLGTSRTVFALGYPVVNVLRSLPSAAVWPLCVIVLGLGIRSQFAVITFGATWPALLSTVSALSALSQEVRDSLAFMQLSRLQRMATQLQWSLPGIFTGIEISCSVAFLLAITVEMLHPGNGGLGWYMLAAREANDAPAAFAGLALTALIGWMLNSIIYYIRRYVLFWEHGARERPRLVRALAARFGASREADRLIARVTNRELKPLLRADHVTAEVRRQFGEGWRLRVLYHEEQPYIWPPELGKIVENGQKVLQRDIVLDAAVDGGQMRPVLFAQSWVNVGKITPATREQLAGGAVTLGDAVLRNERNVSYRNVAYRSVVSDKLGRIFASSGSVETIQRTREILIDGAPAVLVKEYVPILLGQTAVFT